MGSETNMTNEMRLSYCAGIMDSDGYFSIKKSSWAQRHNNAVGYNYSIKIGCKQISQKALLLMSEMFGGNIRKEKPNCEKGKPLFSWQLTDKKAEMTIKKLIPFLIVKKDRAEILLELRMLKSHGRLGIATTIKTNRWKKTMKSLLRVYSTEQRKSFEELYVLIRNLNDTRWCNVPLPLSSGGDERGGT